MNQTETKTGPSHATHGGDPAVAASQLGQAKARHIQASYEASVNTGLVAFFKEQASPEDMAALGSLTARLQREGVRRFLKGASARTLMIGVWPVAAVIILDLPIVAALGGGALAATIASTITIKEM